MTQKLTLFCFLILSPALFFAQEVRPTSPLSVKRIFHQAQTIEEGKVLVFGGQTTNDFFQPIVHASAEIFDESTATWTMAANMNVARSHFASVLTQNGKVLAIGGLNENAQAITSVESYDIETDTWTIVGELENPIHNSDAIILTNGNIFVADHTKANLGSPNGNSWSALPYPAFGESFYIGEFPQIIALENGQFLAVGAQPGPAPNWAATISPTALIDSTQTRMIDEHPNASLIQLDNGLILIGGGTASGITELYNPSTGVFTQTGSFNHEHLGNPFMKMSDGRVATVEIGSTIYPSGDTEILEIYDPNTGEWEVQLGHDFTATTYHTVSPMSNGKYLIVGGWELGGIVSSGTNKCFLFDESSSSTSNTEIASPNFDIRFNPEERMIYIDWPTSTPAIKRAFLSGVNGQIWENYILSHRQNSIPIPTHQSGLAVFSIEYQNGQIISKTVFISNL